MQFFFLVWALLLIHPLGRSLFLRLIYIYMCLPSSVAPLSVSRSGSGVPSKELQLNVSPLK